MESVHVLRVFIRCGIQHLQTDSVKWSLYMYWEYSLDVAFNTYKLILLNGVCTCTESIH